MDWLFGTWIRPRADQYLLNGYDTRFVRTNMRKTSRTPAGFDRHPTGLATPAE
jgi:hypothetical protein